MDNHMATLVKNCSDIVDQFKAVENAFHANPDRRSPEVFARHVMADCEIFHRMTALQEDLVKEAARQDQITISEIDDDSRAYEIEHRGV